MFTQYIYVETHHSFLIDVLKTEEKIEQCFCTYSTDSTNSFGKFGYIS